MSKKKDFDSIFREFSREAEKEKNGHPYPGIYDEEEPYEEDLEEEEDISLTDELDHEILMHRDAHFGGDFKTMLDYYLSDHIGVNPDFEIERIQYLAEVEHQLGKNLAPVLLTGAEAERVAKARDAYRKLKTFYEFEEDAPEYSHLIAELILSEEEEPDQIIDAIVDKGNGITQTLIDLLQMEDAYDPLYPGYGYAPYLAIICLGRIGNPKAIVPLFETLSKELHFSEEVIIEAFAEIGEPAKNFLLKSIIARPITHDNVHAAFALNAFPDDETVALAAFHQLQDPEVREKPLLSLYLLCCCDALRKTSERKAFIELTNDASLPKDLQREMQKMVLDWEGRIDV